MTLLRINRPLSKLPDHTCSSHTVSADGIVDSSGDTSCNVFSNGCDYLPLYIPFDGLCLSRPACDEPCPLAPVKPLVTEEFESEIVSWSLRHNLAVA